MVFVETSGIIQLNKVHKKRRMYVWAKNTEMQCELAASPVDFSDIQFCCREYGEGLEGMWLLTADQICAQQSKNLLSVHTWSVFPLSIQGNIFYIALISLQIQHF